MLYSPIGKEVYTGCGYAYGNKEAKEVQCSKNAKDPILKWNDTFHYCNLTRTQPVYAGCGKLYYSISKRNKNCNNTNSYKTYKWIGNDVDCKNIYPHIPQQISRNTGKLQYLQSLYKLYDGGKIKDDTMLSPNTTYHQKVYNQLKKEEDMYNAHHRTKERIIHFNNEASRRKGNIITVVIGAFSSFLIALFGYILRSNGVINNNTYFVFLCVSLVSFFSISVLFNKFSLQKFEKISLFVKQEIEKGGDALNVAALEWVDDNCDCSKK